jgi:hypothetical protein
MNKALRLPDAGRGLASGPGLRLTQERAQCLLAEGQLFAVMG